MKRIHYIYIVMMAVVGAMFSCNAETDVFEKKLVINEVMASNGTGLMASDGETHDWVEIRNVSEKAQNLKGCVLALDSCKKTWEFPDTVLQPEECLVVFATKKELEGQLSCGFKLKSDSLSLQLRTRRGSLLSEIKDVSLKTDQALRRTKKGNYKKTYEQTPGFSNDAEGYAQYLALIDSQRKDALRIWEYMAKDATGECWVEVKNVSDSPVKLAQYVLKGTKKSSGTLALPDTELAPGQLFAVKDAGNALKGKGVMLMRGGKFVDGVTSGGTYRNVTVGRVAQNVGFYYFNQPTMGGENTAKAFCKIAEGPEFDTKPGVVKGKSVTLKLKKCVGAVHYTTDGSLPTRSSAVMKDSLTIDKPTVFRMFCEGDSTTMESKVVTVTYFVNVNHTLPVVNIAVRHDDLYNPSTGMYVNGPGYTEEFPHTGANYWKKMTRKANVEFYEEGGSFNEECGLAIFGGYSRAEVKKSFKVKFKKEFGDGHLTYDVYKEGKASEIKNMVFRSGSQDIKGVMVRDEFFTSLMAENSPTLLVQKYRPVALYINAEYFGLYYIREKIDKHFVAKYLNVSPDSICILMSKAYQEEGNQRADYLSLLSYVKTHDMTQKVHYDYIKSRVELNGLIDYKLGQIYSQNTDVGNIRYVRSLDANSDKKWHFVFYDIDASWVGGKDLSYYLHASGVESSGSVSMHNQLIHYLLKNKDFRQLFLERLSVHMHKTFTPKNTKRVFDNLIAEIKPEMKLNCERWSGVMTYARWESNVTAFRAKFDNRAKEMLNAIRTELAVTPEENKKYFDGM